MRYLILLALTVGLALPAAAHTQAEWEDWLTDWGQRVTDQGGLNTQLLTEFDDMLARHPAHTYENPSESNTSDSRRSLSTPKPSVGGVERWRPLVESYFKAGDVNTVLCLMGYESGGNPNAYNPSGARGLMQVMPMWAYEFGLAPDQLYDPDTNLEISRWLRDNGGWTHWSPYKRGLCH